jgi:predicted DNA-binding transcriptional regulator AlpA
MKQIDESALKEFDTLPDSAYIRLPVITALIGVSRATVWRWTRQGNLPKSIRISGVTLWSVGALRKSLGLVRRNDAPPLRADGSVAPLQDLLR